MIIENNFVSVLKVGISTEEIKMQKLEVQAIKFVNVNELLEMYENKEIVDRKPVYDELINYLHKY